MDTLILFLAIIVFVRGVSTLFFLLKSMAWLEKNKFSSGDLDLTVDHHYQIRVLIPALREQKNIRATLEYFAAHFRLQGVKIVVITTQREYEKKFAGPSTYEIVTNYIKEKGLNNFISCVDYPGKNGKIANQLNYALKGINNDRSFIILYNADSRPHPDTFKNFFQLLNKYPAAAVFQQSGLYLKKFEHLQDFFKTQALWQTRWSFAHEIPRLTRNSLSNFKFIKTYANANCVGHGLFIRLRELKSIGLFSEKTMNEDTFLAYLLRSKGISIYPLSRLELADSPATLKSLWRQKYVWYWGPLQYLAYFLYVIRNRKTLKINNFSIPLLLFLQGSVSALSWLLSGLLISVLLFSPLFTSIPVSIFSYFSIIVYAPLQCAILYFKLPFLYSVSDPLRKFEFSFAQLIKIIIRSIPAVIFYSVPTYFALFLEINRLIFKKAVYKPKT